MSETIVIVIVVLAVVVVAIGIVTGLLLARRRRISLRQPEGQAPSSGSGSSRYQTGADFDLAPGGSGTAAPPEERPVAERTELDGQPGVGEDAAVPRDAPRPGIVDVTLPDDTDTADVPDTASPATETAPGERETEHAAAAEHAPVEHAPAEQAQPEPALADVAPAEVPPEMPEPEEEAIEPVQGRLERLRGRLSRSRSTLGQGLLGLLGAGDLDEESWEEVEDTLLLADLGSATALEIVETLRERINAQGVRTSEQARAVVRETLVEALRPDLDRALHALPHEGGPAVLLVVGVNGTGKTTTTGKLARVLIGGGRKVMLGAADTFRAAAVDQLQTWGERVGAETVRGKESADPAAVAFDAAKRGVEASVDAVLIDTAGRLHTKTGLMDELGKVKRVVEKQAEVDEVLLVLDATTGQNGLAQARVFAEVVDITGVVLTKLDGTAKGGIVFQVQRELGVPVKLVGLGEGADDLAPFEPEAFVDVLLA